MSDEIEEEEPAPLPPKKKEPKEEEEPPGAPEWVVTFTDMISLLVTFFVLLMTFSSMREYELLEVQGVLPDNKGLNDPMKSHRVLPPPPDDVLANASNEGSLHQPHTRPDEQFDEDSGRADSPEEDELTVDLNRIGDGLVITWGPEYSFAPSSAELQPKLARALDELATVLVHYPHQVVVDGHTAQDHRSTPRFPDALTLSVARALAATERLAVVGGVERSRLQVAGHGSERPLNTGNTVAGRAANRRIELRLLTLSRARAEELGRQIRERGFQVR